MKLTDAEVAYLLKLPDVVNRLARFNRAQAIQSADAGTRMDLLARVRTFERMDLLARVRTFERMERDK